MDEVNAFQEFCNSRSFNGQTMQDAWILYETKHKSGGYFVDFGATDGMHINNSYILEKEYGWNGIVAEPNPVWHSSLLSSRSCSVCLDCVWTETGMELEFLSTELPELSTIKGFGEDDEHFIRRMSHSVIKTKTISLTDLLKKYNAPFNIDYLSIDTEGTELDILSSFFNESSSTYNIDYITVEHNYVNGIRNNIHNLLSSYGYQRKFASISRWDDFYMRIK